MGYYNFLNYLSFLLLIFLGTKVALFLYLSFKHYKKYKKFDNIIPTDNCLVSVIVPAYNEEAVLTNCVDSIIKQDYKNIEIIIVDDGSKDNTKNIGKYLQRKYKGKVLFFSKPNGGKASALNHGILRSKGEIIVSIDADSVFLENTVSNLLKPFIDKNIVAVAGNVKVANRNKLLNKHQAIEYISGLNLQRRSFSVLCCPQVISGAIGAFRKRDLIEVGAYSSDTLVEDMDITISLLENGGKIEYNSNAIAYTEAPENIRDFVKQRYRWVFGGFQVLKKHRKTIFNPKYKSLGVLGLPYFLIFPWIDVFVSTVFWLSVIKAVYFLNPLELISYYLMMSSLQMLLLFYSVHLDKEDQKLTFLGAFESIWYNHLLSFVTLKAGFNFVKGSSVSWNKLARLGKNILPASNLAQA